jgi:hypothetical protein
MRRAIACSPDYWSHPHPRPPGAVRTADDDDLLLIAAHTAISPLIRHGSSRSRAARLIEKALSHTLSILSEVPCACHLD